MFTPEFNEENERRGKEAEKSFTAWLNISGMTYIRPDGTQDTMPQADGLKIKRPDFMIGIPGVGSICVEVKGKTLYNGCLTLDWDEVKRLEEFSNAFLLPVYVVRVHRQDPLLWFCLKDLCSLPIRTIGGVKTVTTLPEMGKITSYRSDFYGVIGEILRLLQPSSGLA